MSNDQWFSIPFLAALHILYIFLIQHTRFSSWSSVVMSWWSESGVINKGDLQNVQSSVSPGPEMRTTALYHEKVRLHCDKCRPRPKRWSNLFYAILQTNQTMLCTMIYI